MGSSPAQGLLASTSQGHLRFSFVGIAPWTGKVSRGGDLAKTDIKKGPFFDLGKVKLFTSNFTYIWWGKKCVQKRFFLEQKCSEACSCHAKLIWSGRSLAFWPFGNFISLENLATPMFTRAVVICGFTFSKKKFEVPTREKSVQDMAVYWQ